MINKSLLFAWGIAIIAFIGSLIFSERMGFVPCTLCWYQRILMYPLVLILGIGFYRNDRNVFMYAIPFAVLGVLVSGYHYAVQKLPSMHEITACASGVPCSGEYINWFGFVTIPFLAFVAFTSITILLVISRKRA